MTFKRRGYLEIKDGRRVLVTACQGSIYEYDDELTFRDVPVPGDGLYRFTGLIGWIKGKRCAIVKTVKPLNLVKLKADLFRRSEVHRWARTGSPGITGYQEREAASQGAQANRAAEAKRLMRRFFPESEAKADG